MLHGSVLPRTLSAPWDVYQYVPCFFMNATPHTRSIPTPKIYLSETGVSRKPDSEVPSAMDPRHNFPMTSEGISNAIGNAKTGDVCFLTWGFDCQTTLSVSKGTVATINRRNVRTKLSMEYIGVQGHKVDNTFKGFLPPQANVRIYKIQWLKKQSAKDKHMNSIPVASPPVTQHTEEDLDLAPMPKLRAIHADFAPCVVAIYRDIMRNYAANSYDDRNDIWNRVLSAMKHSLTVVRTSVDSAKKKTADARMTKTLEMRRN